MSKISDEIHRRFGDSHEIEYVSFGRSGCDKMRELADRVDTEMVELPRDRDGVPIHVGDTVWDMRDWEKLSVIDIVMGAHEVRLYVTPEETVEWYVNPTDLTHTRPDSWERIANELEGWSESNRINGSGEVFYRAGELADRIRRLADKEQGE